ncbi:MAG: sensor histidine kinase, partial [Kiritimatiellae bacterium]|nr:sensor histidine kinase [Kiritimatiellia bacterium]
NIAAEDASGAVLVCTSDEVRPSVLPIPGDTARFAGEVRENVYGRNFAVLDSYELTSRGEAPTPRKLTNDAMLNGSCDYKLARFKGVLKDVIFNETDPDYMLFMIEASNGRGVFTTAPVFDAGAFDKMEALIGRPVEVTGVMVPFDHSPRLYSGRIFKVSGVESIRPLEDAPDAKTRIRGHVVAVRKRARRVILKTDRGEFVSVNLADTSLPSYGECVEASGLEETDLFKRTLFNAQWTKLDGPAYRDEKPVTVSPRELTQDAQGRRKVNCEYYGRPIRVNGTIRSMPENDPEGRMLLDCDGCPVYVDASALPVVLEGLEEGTVVDVSGTCALDVDAPERTSAIPRLRGFTIILRTPSDITVVRRPAWWTPAKLATVIGALLAMLVAVTAWNTSLRRLAARKGRQLMREQIGHVAAKLKTEERTRLAVELHDSLAQTLSGISLEIDTAKKLAEENGHGMCEHLGIAARTLKSCRDELRNCLWDLRNRALEASSMNEAIRQTLLPHLRGVEVILRVNVPRSRLTDNTAHAVLRVVRELVLNGVRHGGATKVWIAGAIDDGRAKFSVRDNGSGFDPATAPSFAEGHYGLLGIRERIESLEGEFTIESAPGEGAKATISIPPIKRDSK